MPLNHFNRIKFNYSWQNIYLNKSRLEFVVNVLEWCLFSPGQPRWLLIFFTHQCFEFLSCFLALVSSINVVKQSTFYSWCTWRQWAICQASKWALSLLLKQTSTRSASDPSSLWPNHVTKVIWGVVSRTSSLTFSLLWQWVFIPRIINALTWSIKSTIFRIVFYFNGNFAWTC